MKWLNTVLAAAMFAGAMLVPSVSRAQDAMKDAVVGTMDIRFDTRSDTDDSGKPKAGVTDKYNLSMTVGQLVGFSGKIERQPQIASWNPLAKRQPAQYAYSVDLSVANPKDLAQKRTVGKWVGTMLVDPKTGVYQLDKGLRISVDTMGTVEGFQENFGGRLVGKAEKKDNLVSNTYKRLVGDREVSIVVKKSDPMRFENLELASGPMKKYSRTTVNGTLDYDYETGNYFADNIKLKYMVDGKDVEDTVTGTIKWVEDPNRKTNGKGHYEFNIRFNEAKNKPAAGEAAVFAKMKDEDAFFATDTSIPCLTGNVEYVDTMNSDKVVASKVTYKLESNKLSREQVVNFMKLWLTCVGPTNDE